MSSPSDTAPPSSRRGAPASEVPERRRVDATVFVAAASSAPAGAPAAPASQGVGTRAFTTFPSAQPQRDVIVPSTTSVNALLEHIRRPATERLEIASSLASGGMGRIDIAVDRALDRRIALKTLHAHLRTSETAVRMFLREARLNALLDHPHIVPVYDIGERDGDQLYFEMKLVEGQTLAALVRGLPRGPLPAPTLYALLDVVTKVCDALAFAHSRGVIHCDIKPSNVMVGDFGQVYLMDWGIARLVAVESGPSSRIGTESPPPGGLQTDESIIGTPCYMSPEQARGDRSKLDARSDVFLLGALLYEVLTRQPPYPTRDRSEALALAASATFPSPRKVVLDGSVHPELERIVLRAMAADPEERYPTASALREDLTRFMRGGAEFPREAFPVGATIVREGDPGDAAFIIVSGRCEVRRSAPSGSEFLLTLGPGDVFGEMAILTEGPRTASVVAVEETTVLVVTAAVLEQEMAALKPWMATLLKSVASRFRETDTKHRATFTPTPSPERLANQMLMHVVTWGEDAGGRARAAAWSALAREVEAQMGVPPLALFGVASRYGMQVDVAGDRLVVPDVPALIAQVARDLGRV